MTNVSEDMMAVHDAIGLHVSATARVGRIILNNQKRNQVSVLMKNRHISLLQSFSKTSSI